MSAAPAVDAGPGPTSAPRSDDVWNVVEAVWESLLGVWPTPAEAVQVGADWPSALVRIEGGWRGTVALSCPPRTAQHVARTMLDLSGDEAHPDTDAIEDAVREAANVIGGNVKALVAGGDRLSLPTVTAGPPAVDGDLVVDIAVGWPGHVARLGVWRTPS